VVLPPTNNPIAPQAAYISRTTPTAAAVNGILTARIQSIRGTTITLAGVTARATATSQPAAHDNSPVVVAGCNAIGAGGSGTLYIPSTGSVPFNSVLNLRDNCPFPTTPNKFKLLVNGSQLFVNEPIVARDQNTWIESVGGGGPTFAGSTGINSEITGNAYPLIYVPKGNGPTTVLNFLMDCYNAYQSCVVEDQDSGRGGTVNTDYENVNFVGHGGSMPFIERGGAFEHRFKRGGFTAGGFFGVPESLLITIPNSLGLTTTGGSAMGGAMIFDQTNFADTGVLFESWGQVQIVGYATFLDNIYENGITPLIRFNIAGGQVQGFNVVNPSYSDGVAASTPLIELGIGNTAFLAFRLFNPQCNGDFQPMFASGGGGIEIIGGCKLVGASSYSQQLIGSSSALYYGASVATNGGSFYTQMANPLPPASLVASAGGNVPNGLHYYSIVATDVNNNSTLTSQQIGVTTAGANKTVTITPPTLPVGATGYRVYRNDSGSTYGTLGALLVCAQATKPALPGVAIVDTQAVTCGVSAPGINTAGITALTSNGVYVPSVVFTSTAFARLGTPINGTFYYCNDCTVANPCAGGGTGALAKRLNGIWVCN
jgi:hypothetical protein